TDRIDSVAAPTPAPDTSPMPPILPVKREWRAAVLEAAGGAKIKALPRARGGIAETTNVNGRHGGAEIRPSGPRVWETFHCLKHQYQYCGETEGNTKSDELPCPSSVRLRLTFEMQADPE